MANYGEELVYWYLRLNGFFPITNYVVHRSPASEYTSDVDILAVRFPHVYEEVGGQQQDWDSELQRQLNFAYTVGLICEVKTGSYYNQGDLFPPANISHAVKRLGFVADASLATEALRNRTDTSVGQIQIAKLLIAKRPPQGQAYFFLSLAHVIDFIKQRVIMYKNAKFADRMFFSSVMLQTMIAEMDL